MLVRIVKMSFSPDKLDEFLDHFNSINYHIRNFPGNQHLELLKDLHQPNVFFTYSYWNSESDLENYRNSEIFKQIWEQTKPLFNDKPMAWSVEKIVSLP